MSSLDSKISALENLTQQACSAASQFSEAAETLRKLTGSLNSSAEALTASPQMWGGSGSRAFDAYWFKYQTYSTQKVLSSFYSTRKSRKRKCIQMAPQVKIWHCFFEMFITPVNDTLSTIG